MIRRLLTITTAFVVCVASATGCRGLLGIHDLSDDSNLDGGQDDAADDASSDASNLGQQQDGTLEDGSHVDARWADVAVSDAADAALGTSRDAGTCTPGSVCVPAECETGSYHCGDGGTQCIKTSNVADGMVCGSGSGHVCHQGACVACAVGADCTPANSCQKMTNDCSSGVALCAPAGSVNNGTPCGTNLFCSNGVCTACSAGSACTPAGSPCHAGKVVCAQGQATCVDQQTSAPNGQGCGTNAVCDLGNCQQCTAGLTCTPSSNVCDKGVTDCSTGTQTCKDQGTGDHAQNGATCTTGSVCHNGSCTACAAGGDCRPSGSCQIQVNVCTSGTAVCTPGSGSVTDGTSCGGADHCCAGNCINPNGSDSNNCGGCGMKCASGTTCSAGHCVCNTSSGCTAGCCANGNTCVLYAGQTAGIGPGPGCGTSGAACAACGVSGETCNSGVCGCPNGVPMCAGGCVDVNGSDANNCGACGHSCKYGTCLAGACQPWVIAQPPTTTAPAFVGFDGTTVAWVDSSSTMQTAAAPGGNATDVQGAGGSWTAFTMVSGAIELGTSSSGFITRCALNEPAGTTACSLFGGQNTISIAVTGLALSGSHLFYVRPGGSVYDTCIGGAGPTPCNPVISNASGLLGTVTADANYMFAADTSGFYSTPVGATSAAYFMTNPFSSVAPQYITDGTYLYFASAASTSNAVYRVPESSPGSPAQQVGSNGYPFASDGKYLYLSTTLGIYYNPAGGGSPKPLAPGKSAPLGASSTQMAVAAGILVWISGNTIYGVAVPQ